jgi:thioredoxin 1
MTESVTELSEKQFDEFTKKGIVFIDFFADWCMPCVMMAPIVEDVSKSFAGKIKFGKVNVNDNENLARKFDVSSIPTFIVFKDGKKIEEFTGAMDGNELEDKLNKFV